MSDQTLLLNQRNQLMSAMAALLRQTANPDPLHPAYRAARDKATAAYQDVAKTMPNPPD